jgi:hypothetical protein
VAFRRGEHNVGAWPELAERNRLVEKQQELM